MKKDDPEANKLTHVDQQGQPTMVNVSEKRVTLRRARACSWVVLNKTIVAALRAPGGGSSELYSAKGPVFQTAIIAGTMAVKKTSELIPFCHPLLIDSCSVDVSLSENFEVRIECTVTVTGKTGVEMEALVGASVAALTVYDMCKALSPDLVIRETQLLEKSGGKRDFTHPSGPNT